MIRCTGTKKLASFYRPDSSETEVCKWPNASVVDPFVERRLSEDKLPSTAIERDG
jgi:hypothetical protein